MYYPLIFTNDIVYLKSRRIQEYDIVEGGFSVSKEKDLLPKDFICFLSALTKHERHVEIGKYIRENKDFNNKLFEGFREFVFYFCKENKISEEKILSIKKDSVTFFDSNIKRSSFGEVVFTPRARATSFALINGKEFFVNTSDNKEWFNGFNEDFYYKDTLIEEIFNLLRYGETKDNRFLFEYIRELRTSYVDLSLCDSYYKELSPNNGFLLKKNLIDYSIYADHIKEGDIDSIDISYNYLNYILPICNLFQ